jgi:hypothetical protein
MNEKIIVSVLVGLSLLFILWEVRKITKKLQLLEDQQTKIQDSLNKQFNEEKQFIINKLKKQNTDLLENYTKIIKLNEQKINKMNQFVEMEDSDDENIIHPFSESIKMNSNPVKEEETEYYHSEQEGIHPNLEKIFTNAPILKNLMGSIPSKIASFIVDIQTQKTNQDIGLGLSDISDMSIFKFESLKPTIIQEVFINSSSIPIEDSKPVIEVIENVEQKYDSHDLITEQILDDQKLNNDTNSIHEDETKQNDEPAVQTPHNNTLNDTHKVNIIDDLEDSIYSSISFKTNKKTISLDTLDVSKDVGDYSTKDLKIIAKELNLPLSQTKDGKNRALNKQELYNQIKNIIKN